MLHWEVGDVAEGLRLVAKIGFGWRSGRQVVWGLMFVWVSVSASWGYLEIPKNACKMGGNHVPRAYSNFAICYSAAARRRPRYPGTATTLSSLAMRRAPTLPFPE